MHELGILPCKRIVALSTIRREPGLHVIRVTRPLVVIEVATRTVGRKRTQPALVACRTIDLAVAPLQREGRGVIEGHTLPRRGIVALHTVRREARLHVIGVVGPLVIGQVATRAVRRQRTQPALMARRAVQPAVALREREGGRVHEIRVLPGDRVVALGAVGRETRQNMIRLRRLLVI